MSGQKKLDRATRNIRVVAMPSKEKKVERIGADGKPFTETIQLYKVRKMK